MPRGESIDGLPEELAVWLETSEVKKEDAREIDARVRAIMAVNQASEQLELTARDVVQRLDSYMEERKREGFHKFMVNLPPGGYRIVDTESGDIVDNEPERFEATGVQWAGRRGVEFINDENGTKLEISGLDFIIEPVNSQ